MEAGKSKARQQRGRNVVWAHFMNPTTERLDLHLSSFDLNLTN